MTRGTALLGGLGSALVAVCVLGATQGAFDTGIADAWGVLMDRLGIGAGPTDTTVDQVLWEIRFPRVALAVVVGAALGTAGACMQGAFANPLAEPGIVGVSSGAVCGAVAQIVLGVSPLGSWSLPAAAFVGGLISVTLAYASAHQHGRTEVVTLILTGVALNAFLGAVIGLFTYFSDDEELRTLTFWTLGSVAAATWSKVVVVAPLAVAGIAAAVAGSRRLDLLALGDRAAGHLGVPVERCRRQMLAVTALLTAAAVAVSGIILFIGLVVPHMIRMVAGPGHRLLLPASALGGATILVGADLLARTVAAPLEIPLGVLTSLLGSPVFFWQLRRTRDRQGGWA